MKFFLCFVVVASVVGISRMHGQARLTSSSGRQQHPEEVILSSGDRRGGGRRREEEKRSFPFAKKERGEGYTTNYLLHS